MVLVTPILIGEWPTYLIAGVTAYYFNSGNRTILYAKTFTAYGCGVREHVKEKLRFIHETVGVFCFK